MRESGQFLEQAFYNDLTCYAKSGAKFGAIFGGGISLVSNAQECYNGDKTISEAVIDVAKDTGSSAINGAGIGLATAGTKQALIRAGAQNLAKGSAPVAIATSVIEAGVNISSDLPKLLDGNIGGGEFAIRTVGHTTSAAAKGCGTWGGAELGASIGAVGGPLGIAAGGIIGGTLGYLASSGAVNWVKSWF